MASRILIADDDLHTRKILETLLAREPALGGPEIVAVGDGQEALAQVSRAPFDLVITDLLMPRMDGFAFARALRGLANGRTVPLLVTSAIYKDRVALGRLEQDTRCEFFAKPFQLRELVRAVTRHLGPREAHRQASGPGRERARPTVQEGSLTERSVPRLLLELHDAGATGVLSLSRARLKKEIFILVGHPIGADSNLRNETLGQVLLARGALEPEKLTEALELSRTGRDRLGAILVAKGWMKESEVLGYLAAQVRLKIVTALRWPDGEYRFLPGDSFSGRMTHLTVDAARIVFAGLKQTGHIDEIARAAAAAPKEAHLSLDPRFEKHREPFVKVFGEATAQAVAARPRAGEIAASRDDLLLACDALRMTGLAAFHEGREATPLPIGAQARETARATARTDALYRQLFGEEEPALASSPVTMDLQSSGESGVFALPSLPSAVEPGSASPARGTDPGVRGLHEALLREYLTIHSRDHYQVLGVARDASAAAIAAAHAERRERFRPERFHGVDLGRDRSRLETLHQAFQEAFEVLSDPARRAAYDRSLEPAVTSGGRDTSRGRGAAYPAIEAEAQFHEAARLLAAGQPLAAVPRLREAVRLHPDQADYHATLGFALFLARDPAALPPQAISEARAELASALAIDPDHVAAHEYLGRLLFAMGDVRAADHLEKALALDPGRPEALQAMAAACLRAGQHARLERLYRSQIARLGEARAARLWWDLGVLLRDHLRDRASAQAAFEAYARLMPDDARAAEALGALREAESLKPGSLADLRARATALRTAWRAAPTDGAPGRALLALHLEAGRLDEALVVAAALDARGVADEVAAELLARHAGRQIRRAVTPLASRQIDAIRHVDDDRELAALYTRLFLAVPPPLPLPDGARALAADEVPPPFAAALAAAAWLLDVPAPRVLKDGARGPILRFWPISGGAGGAALVAGEAVLAERDRGVLAFRLGRALSGAVAARGHGLALPTATLKAYLKAASGLVSQGVDLDGEAAVLRARFARTPHLAGEIRPILTRLSSRNAPIALSRWVRGVVHSGDRIGLVACNDLTLAVRVLAEDGGNTADLIDFALSDEAAEVRRDLGLAVAGDAA